MIFNIRQISDKPPVIDYIQKLPDKPYTIKVTTKRISRTVSQNKLLWLWLTCLQDETGNDKQDLHYYMKAKFLPKKQIQINGSELNIPISTTSLDTKQFTEYLDKIQVFASSELGVILPDPNDLNWDNFYETYKDRI